MGGHLSMCRLQGRIGGDNDDDSGEARYAIRARPMSCRVLLATRLAA